MLQVKFFKFHFAVSEVSFEQIVPIGKLNVWYQRNIQGIMDYPRIQGIPKDHSCIFIDKRKYYRLEGWNNVSQKSKAHH